MSEVTPKALVTLFFKDKVGEDGEKVGPVEQEVVGLENQGSTITLFDGGGYAFIFPWHELEAAVVAMYEEGANAEPGDNAAKEGSEDGARLFIPDFGGSDSGDETVS